MKSKVKDWVEIDQWVPKIFELRSENDRFFPADHYIIWRAFFGSVLFSKEQYLANYYMLWTKKNFHETIEGFGWTVNGPRTDLWEAQK